LQYAFARIVVIFENLYFTR